MQKALLILTLLVVIGGLVFLVSSKKQKYIYPSHRIMRIASPEFENGNPIPPQYTCDGIDINPPITIEMVPEGAKSLALIVDDPDAPAGTWVHWIMWNIPISTTLINEHFLPNGVVEGTTSFGKQGWGGPCPPNGVHRYFFRLFALDTEISIPTTSTRLELEKAMQGHIIDNTELMGTYIREVK